MYRVVLDEAGRRELDRRTKAPGVMPRTRTRLEMVRLCAAGFGVPQIAQHFGLGEPTVRRWLRRFLSEGWDALSDLPHVGQKSSLTPELMEALRAKVREGGRTWTARQLSDWLAEEHGLRLVPDYLARRMRQSGLSYKRTRRTLRHKQDATQVQEKRQQLQALEKRGSGSARPGTSG